MSWECFEKIVQAEKKPTSLLLQGITNGSIAIDSKYLFLVDDRGFPLDTLDENIAHQSSRSSPSQTPKKIKLYAVNCNQTITVQNISMLLA